MEIDVIIPVYKPDKSLFGMLEMLMEQSYRPHKVILVNTEEKYFEQLVYGNREMEKYKDFVEVHHISKREFDHGRTRNFGVSLSKAEFFVFMTQDAVPADCRLLENLLKPFMAQGGERTAGAYARQLAGENSSVLEQFARDYNYPNKSVQKSIDDLPVLGIKTYFFSNVCAAYRREVFDQLGGFVNRAIFNEDMIYACKALKKGYRIAYVSEACVIHSHNYNCRQQFKRNFDIGVSQSMHPEVFRNVRSESEGRRMVKEAVAYLKKTSKEKEIPGFYLQCASKYAGYLLGMHYRRLPRKLVLKCTSNREFWMKEPE